jgi:lipopolysaccharide/colanic/teichoic acid biosynthesis glycosyltransferase
MKIAIVGATGFVGRNLVPLLKASGAEILLIGRDAAHLQSIFPEERTFTYADMASQISNFDALLHLAVVNNDSDAPEDVFYEVNVHQMLEIAETCTRAGVGHFVLVSSTHALDQRNLGFYAASKREAVRRLAELEGITTSVVYLPAVYADHWAGQLAGLNALPRPLGRVLFGAVAALKPTVHVSRLADFLLSGRQSKISDAVILSDGQQNNVFYRAIRRIVDISFALTVLVLFWWLLLVIWILVRFQSAGPGIFAQKRVGRTGKVFKCYKFRTMRTGTAERGTHEIGSSAVTSIGGFLRRTKLDELPQIFNILRNEVSLVGPRPCLPVQTELVEARRLRGVLELKPGITGLAQVNGVDMSEPETLARWDARYGALQSLMFDLRIILATAIGRGQGDRTR